jgi:arylsulfatase A-like enzyme
MADAEKPNILVIWGDDISITNVSCDGDGLMDTGRRTSTGSPMKAATGQFGKNHLCDVDTYLPTVRGFDELFGNLYRVDAEAGPELPNDPPKDEVPRFRGAGPVLPGRFSSLIPIDPR